MSTIIPKLSSASSNPNINLEKLLNELPKTRFWETVDIYQWEGYWFTPQILEPIIPFISNFHARDDDVLLASAMKTGTTWLKALSLCIMQKGEQNHEDILTIANPHVHVPTIEVEAYSTKEPQIDIYDTTASHLLHTHLPYALLPDSIKNSGCKIVYIARNPKDTLISSWFFLNSRYRKNEEPLFPLEKAVDCFCSGVYINGPFFDHVAEYWRESQKRPEKIMFLKYEELKSDPKRQVAKIAEFLGRPFVDDKEVEEVILRSSFERLKNLDVNKSESSFSNAPNKSYFRKGEVGDWRNYLSPEMEEKMNQISRIELEPLGLFL